MSSSSPNNILANSMIFYGFQFVVETVSIFLWELPECAEAISLNDTRAWHNCEPNLYLSFPYHFASLTLIKDRPIFPISVEPSCVCPQVYKPVCDISDGNMYSNMACALCDGADPGNLGPCSSGLINGGPAVIVKWGSREKNWIGKFVSKLNFYI